jgi:hypothetical protein
MQRQTDIQAYGHVLSYTLIYVLNVLGIGLWVVLVSPATLEQFMESLVAGFSAAGAICRAVPGVVSNCIQ